MARQIKRKKNSKEVQIKQETTYKNNRDESRIEIKNPKAFRRMKVGEKQLKLNG